MDVLVLGSGAREHALAWRLARDEGVRPVRIAPGNGGTAAVGETVDLDPPDPPAVARHAARERYDLVVIGPEAPLAAGVADALATGIGPDLRADAGRGPAGVEQGLREGADAAGRRRDRRPAPFHDRGGGAGPRSAQDRPPVVKADWLAAGKGVVVPDTLEEAEAAVRALFAGSAPGARVVLEERLEGREVSAFALVSDETVVPLAAACDYKRLGDGDPGPEHRRDGRLRPVPWFGSDALERRWPRSSSRSPGAWRATGPRTAASCTPA